MNCIFPLWKLFRFKSIEMVQPYATKWGPMYCTLMSLAWSTLTHTYSHVFTLTSHNQARVLSYGSQKNLNANAFLNVFALV